MAYTVHDDEHRRTYRDETITYRLEAVTDPDRTPLITCKNTKHQIYVQRISAHITTLAAQAITFASSGGTTVAILPASATVGDDHVLFDFMEGYALPAGEHLNVSGAAGVAGLIEVVAFQKLVPGAAGVLPSDL